VPIPDKFILQACLCRRHPAQCIEACQAFVRSLGRERNQCASFSCHNVSQRAFVQSLGRERTRVCVV